MSLWQDVKYDLRRNHAWVSQEMSWWRTALLWKVPQRHVTQFGTYLLSQKCWHTFEMAEVHIGLKSWFYQEKSAEYSLFRSAAFNTSASIYLQCWSPKGNITEIYQQIWQAEATRKIRVIESCVSWWWYLLF